MADAPKLSKKEDAFMDAKQKGNDAIGKKEWNRAIMFYTEALKSAPSHYFQAEGQAAACFSNRSFANLKSGQFKKALEDAQACASMRPSWSKAHFRMGEAYRYMGMWGEAAGCYRRGSACDPNDLDLIEYLADAEERAKYQGTDPDGLLPLEERLGVPLAFAWQARLGVFGLVLGTLLIGFQPADSRNLVSDLLLPAAFALLAALLGTFVRMLRLRRWKDKTAPPRAPAAPDSDSDDHPDGSGAGVGPDGKEKGGVRRKRVKGLSKTLRGRAGR